MPKIPKWYDTSSKSCICKNCESVCDHIEALGVTGLKCQIYLKAITYINTS